MEEEGDLSRHLLSSDQNVLGNLVIFENYIWQSKVPGRARGPVKALNKTGALG